jgi:hypothetical protein
MQIAFWITFTCLLISFALFFRDILKNDIEDHETRVRVRSARNRLTTRLIKSEIRSTSRHLRRQLDDELKRIEQ